MASDPLVVKCLNGHINMYLGHAGFVWKQFARKHTPWFPELQDVLVDEESMHGKDERALFYWVERATMPVKWTLSLFVGVADRWRIWNMCEEMVGLNMRR